MSRTCSICSSTNADEVRLAVLGRETDTAISERFGFSRSAVQRHRVDHIEAPARAVAAAAAKGHDKAKERQALAAATADDARVWLTLGSIAGDLKKVHDRLDQAAEEAAADKQRMALSSLSGQLIRASEVRAKLGGIGQECDGQGASFSLRIFLGEKPIVIEGDPAAEADYQIG